MIFTWYKIFNKTDFLALDLPSKTYTQILDGIGQVDILVTNGNLISMLYDGIFLPVELNDLNPSVIPAEPGLETLAYASYIDDNDDVYLGIEEPDEN